MEKQDEITPQDKFNKYAKDNNIILNNAKVLLFSEKYKRFLVDNEKGNYYKNNAIVIGNYLKKSNFLILSLKGFSMYLYEQ